MKDTELPGPPGDSARHAADCAYVYRRFASSIRPRAAQDDGLPPLDEYVDLPGLLPDVQSSFPSPDSVRWFVRRHRDELAASGAVVIIAGRMRFHPGRFKQTVVQIGQRAAA